MSNLIPARIFSFQRVGAMILRYLYLLRGSWPRIIEQAYWPTVQMIIWGFITQFLATNSSWVAQTFGVLISAVLLWGHTVSCPAGRVGGIYGGDVRA